MYVEPDSMVLATLNVEGGGSDDKAVMVSPVLPRGGGMMSALHNDFRPADLLFITELRNEREMHSQFAKRFGDAGSPSYFTKHVGLLVGRRWAGHKLTVTSSQDGRVMRVALIWKGKPVVLTGLYAPAYKTRRARQRFYAGLELPHVTEHQVVLGDWQHVLNPATDSSNPHADNVGLREWEHTKAAYVQQAFSDLKSRENDDELNHTWEGPHKWGDPRNCRKRIDRIEASSTMSMVPESWRTVRMWGTLDHAMVMAELLPPGGTVPDDDPDAIPPMQVAILRLPAFQAAARVDIGGFDWTRDPREELDALHARLHKSHGRVRKAERAKVYAAAKAAVAALGTDEQELQDNLDAAGYKNASATHRGELRQRLHAEARAAIETAAHDTAMQRTIHDQEWSRLSTRAFFKQASVRTPASTFPYQLPFHPKSDEAKLTPGLHELGNGGYAQYGDKDRWHGREHPVPTPATSNERITENDKMRDNTHLFYSCLFAKRNLHEGSRARIIDAARRMPTIPAEQAAQAGEAMTAGEVRTAVKMMQPAKSPGPDGIVSELYKIMIDDMDTLLAHVANAVFAAGEFSVPQRTGTIVLIWKGKGDPGDLTKSRPVSNLCRITTIVSTVLANRLSKLLPACVRADQTGFLAGDGRRMHENICKATDALMMTKDKGIAAACISVDMEKAFDRVDRALLLDLYDIVCGREPPTEGSPLSERHPVTRWMAAIMHDQIRAVRVNGLLTPELRLRSGIPQGDVMSALSYILFSEPLAIMLHEMVRGIPVPAVAAPRCDQSVERPRRWLCTLRYADDTIFIVRPHEVGMCLEVLMVWCAGAGMKCNSMKTEGMWIGSMRNSVTPWSSAVHGRRGDSSMRAALKGGNMAGADLVWLPPRSSMRVLGAPVGYAVRASDVWEGLMASMIVQMRLWALVALSISARVLVLKTMVWSRAWFLAAYYPPPPILLPILTRMSKLFVHNGRLPAGTTPATRLAALRLAPSLATTAMTRRKRCGGLALWEPALHIEAQAAKWIALLLEPRPYPTHGIACWTDMPRYYMQRKLQLHGSERRGLGALCDGAVKSARRAPAGLPGMWAHAWKAWAKYRKVAVVVQPSSRAEVLGMSIWDNVHVPRAAAEHSRPWVLAGVELVSDLYNGDGTAKSVDELQTACERYGGEDSGVLTQAKVNGARLCVPAAWRYILRGDDCDSAPRKGSWWARSSQLQTEGCVLSDLCWKLEACESHECPYPTFTQGSYVRRRWHPHRRCCTDWMHMVQVQPAGRWAVGCAAGYGETATRVVVATAGAQHRVQDYAISAARTAMLDAIPHDPRAHQHALSLARCSPHLPVMNWGQVWDDGWQSPWPTDVRDMWWRMAAGTRWVAYRRHHILGQRDTADCRCCAHHRGQALLDTNRHLYYECPSRLPLERWVRQRLRQLGELTVPSPTHFMLYGDVTLPPQLDGSPAQHERVRTWRARSFVRASMVQAFAAGRTAVTRPDAIPAYTGLQARHADALLKAYIRTDWYSATRAHHPDACTMDGPLRLSRATRYSRPTNTAAFGPTWAGLARVKAHKQLALRF